MNRFRTVVLSILVLVVNAAASGQGQQSLEQILRLKPGNSWTYRGTVEWVDTSEKSGTASRQITWKSEIMEESVHGQLKAYMIPLDCLEEKPALGSF